MNQFVSNISNQMTTTANGAKTRLSSSSACVDLFYKIGSSRGQNIVPDFVKAWVENQDVAIRILLWARDIRGGAGERDLFRSVFKFMYSNSQTYGEYCLDILMKLPEIGRWDDMLIVFESSTNDSNMDHIAKLFVSTLFYNAIQSGNGLAAKWAPRQGPIANFMRNSANMPPKEWRKFVVQATNVVEQQMCSNQWPNIEYAKVPSQAARIYTKAFKRHDPVGYDTYKAALVKGETKINATTLYPYQIIRDLRRNSDVIIAEAQWNSLPDYIGDQKILPVIDVSGSMSYVTLDSSGLYPLDVAVSLGLYCADKNKGAFKDVYMTFSADPRLIKNSGSLKMKLDQIKKSNWGLNTNIEKTFQEILKYAKDNKVPVEDMPQYILILSDMQFDPNAQHSNSTALKMIRMEYKSANYDMPMIVFWNLVGNRYNNVPAKSNSENVAMVSGFSPSIMRSILSGKVVTPEDVMLETIMNTRYDYKGQT